MKKEVKQFVEECVQTNTPPSILEQLRTKRAGVAREAAAQVREINRETGIKLRELDAAINAVQASDPEAIIAQGDADAVALARAMLYDPHWPWHKRPAHDSSGPHCPRR